MSPSASESEKRALLALARDEASGTDRRLRESEFARAVAACEANDGATARGELVRHVLAELAKENADQIDRLNYPASVRTLIQAEFARIEKACSDEEDDYFDFGLHRLRSELRIVCFGRIPVGPEHMEVDGLPRSVLYRGGPAQCVRYLRTVRQAGGRSPFYVLHMAHGIPPAAFAFVYSPKAQKKMFRNLAGCLEMNPACRGVIDTGWLLDPRLDLVSPHLSYLRQGWVENGEALFRWGKESDAVVDATTRSPHRKRLHGEGKYRPQSYMVVWLRESLIAWAQQD